MLAEALCVRPFTVPFLIQAGKGIFCDFYRSFGTRLGQNHCELISAQATEYVDTADTAQQDAGNHFQQRVACLMAAGVIEYRN